MSYGLSSLKRLDRAFHRAQGLGTNLLKEGLYRGLYMGILSRVFKGPSLLKKPEFHARSPEPEVANLGHCTHRGTV